MVLSKEDRKEYYKIRYQENSEEYKERSKKWAKENPEKARKSNKKALKKWRENNPEKAIEWIKEHPEEYKEYQRQWRKENPNSSKKWSKEHPEEKKEHYIKSRYNTVWFIDLFLCPYKCCICRTAYDSVCLDFHHINPKLKKFSVSSRIRLVNTQPLELIEEILKCLIVCKNCHALIENKKIKLKKIKNRLI